MYTNNKTQFNLVPKTIGGIFEDIFQNGFQKVFYDDNWNREIAAPVNIHETDNAYELQLMAPGLNKEDFKLNVDRNILHISYEHKEENKETSNKWLRKEYKLEAFRRSFTLNDKINATGIAAKYTDGILYVTLPKKEVKEPTTQEIKID